MSVISEVITLAESQYSPYVILAFILYQLYWPEWFWTPKGRVLLRDTQRRMEGNVENIEDNVVNIREDVTHVTDGVERISEVQKANAITDPHLDEELVEEYLPDNGIGNPRMFIIGHECRADGSGEYRDETSQTPQPQTEDGEPHQQAKNISADADASGSPSASESNEQSE